MATTFARDNTVIYKIYSLSPAEDLQKLRDDILGNISDRLASYIWQRDAFGLHIINGCLFGEVFFDDNMEDEWFIVYLILDITKRFKDVIAEIYDEDGQFLLIEAADVLPKWMSPEVCLNRVFLYRGSVHVISPKQMPDIKSALEGARYVSQHCDQTIAHSAIMQCIMRRIGGYPDLITTNQHSVNCFIPANLAVILSERPQIISVGVGAFCDAVVTNIKRPKVMAHFRPINRVLSRVTMTKCQYAQLMFHKFIPDRKEGWATADLISTLGVRALDLGTKLAYGFEYACRQAEARPKPPNQETVPLPDESLFRTPAFDRFLQSLTRNGYFRGLLEGSRDYQRLLSQARAYYADSFSSNAKPVLNTSSDVILLEMVRKLEKIDTEKLKRQNANLPPDDDDTWLYDFDGSLNAVSERAGFSINGNGNGNGHSNGNGSHNKIPIDELVSKMNSFVTKLSSTIDGVEVEGSNGNGDCRHVDSDSSAEESDDEEVLPKNGAVPNKASSNGKPKNGGAGGGYMQDFIFESDEYSDNDGDSSLDEDYSSDKQMKLIMKQMDAELSLSKNIGKDEVRSKPASKVLASNLIKSCQAEGGRSGPAGIMLKQLNIKVPSLCQPDSDDDE